MNADPAVSLDPLAALYDCISPAVEDAMIDAWKALSRTVPAARNDPFYGLDRRCGPSLRTIERLTAHGDFRKYVFVLDGGGGSGSLARWLVATYGCRVLVLDVWPRLLAVGQRLSKRTGFLGRISAVAGDLSAIPLRHGVFTQIWSVAALQHVSDKAAAVRELFRVLRPGSTLALHEIVRRSASVPTIGSPWHHGTEDDYLELLAGAGFTTITTYDVSAEPLESSAVTSSADEAFHRLLAERSPTAAHAWHASLCELERVQVIERSQDYRTIQLFARRPSI